MQQAETSYSSLKSEDRTGRSQIPIEYLFNMSIGSIFIAIYDHTTSQVAVG